MREGGDGTSSEVARLSAECSTSTASGGEAEALDLGGGVDAEGSRVERWVVSRLLCVGREVTGLGGVVSVRRLSVVVWSMVCRETEQDILLFRSGASVRVSSTRTGAVLPWPCGTAGVKVV